MRGPWGSSTILHKAHGLYKVSPATSHSQALKTKYIFNELDDKEGRKKITNNAMEYNEIGDENDG